MAMKTSVPERSVLTRAADFAVAKIRSALFGPDTVDRHWVRLAMNESLRAHIAGLKPEGLSALEISGDWHGSKHPWKEHRTLHYPSFDLCAPPEKVPQADVVICEQVLEHVVDPVTAAKTLRELCRPGGHVVVSTPFMLRVHPSPGDYWRFTEDGLRLLLENAGLEVVETHSWGNKAAVQANGRVWAYHWPWRPMRNDWKLPIMVWAFCRRPA